MAYEKDIKDLIEQMQRQQGSMSGYKPPENPMGGGFSSDPGMGTDQSPHMFGNQNNINNNSPDQSPLNPVNSVRPMGTPINKQPPKPAGMVTSGDGCPQCGLVHPPVAQGQRCPMAPVKVKGSDGQEKVVDVNKFLANLKNIILSQAEQRKVQDVEKLFKNIIVEVTKYLEGYSE